MPFMINSQWNAEESTSVQANTAALPTSIGVTEGRLMMENPESPMWAWKMRMKRILGFHRTIFFPYSVNMFPNIQK